MRELQYAELGMVAGGQARDPAGGCEALRQISQVTPSRYGRAVIEAGADLCGLGVSRLREGFANTERQIEAATSGGGGGGSGGDGAPAKRKRADGGTVDEQ